MQDQSITRRCARCGKIFTPPPSNVRRGHGIFCSRSCVQQSRGKTIADHFWPRVQKAAGCWLWQGYRTEHGYGRVDIGSTGNGTQRPEFAHRISWILHYGNIPAGKHVLHNCPDGDNPSCVNPAHLWLGTHQENVADCIAKGRNNRGERQGLAKLTEPQVREARARYGAGGITHRELAEMFGVTRRVMAKAVSGDTWAHVI